MSGADLIEYRLDRLEKSEEKKLELITKMNEKVDNLIQQDKLTTQRDRYIMSAIVIVGSIAVDYIKKIVLGA